MIVRPYAYADLLLGLLQSSSELGLTLDLIMNHLGTAVVETRVSSPTFAVSQVTNVRSKSAVPLLHAVAFSSPERGRLSLMVINQSLAGAMPTTIRFQGFTPQAEARVWTLSGNSVMDHNENRASTVLPQPGQITDAGASFSYTFGAHSLMVLEFRAQP